MKQETTLLESKKQTYKGTLDLFNIYFFYSDANNRYMYDNNSGFLIAINDVDESIIDYYRDNISLKDLFQHTPSEIEKSVKYIDAAINCGMLKKLPMITVDESLVEYLYKTESLNVLILILGENCNMRCKYCIFGDCYDGIKSYTNKAMSFEVAKNAIDYFYESGKEKMKYGNKQDFGLTFYGGEPLLYFETLKKIIEYCKDKKYPFNYALTTNATLINDEICKFIVDNNINVTISLDGDEKETNRKRVLKDGSGAFDVIMENTTKLHNAYTNSSSERPQVFNSCIDFATNINEVEEFFEGLPLPKYVGINPISDYNTTYYEQFTEEDKEQFNKRNLLKRKEIIKRETDDDRTGVLRNSFLLRHHSFRTRSTRPNYLNAFPCIPGSRITVDTDGNFYLCERINQQRSIGNINQGINYSAIVDLCKDLLNVHENHCKNCNVSRLCTLCFTSIIYNNEFNFDSKKCPAMRDTSYRIIQETVSALEKNPTSFLYEFKEAE